MGNTWHPFTKKNNEPHTQKTQNTKKTTIFFVSPIFIFQIKMWLIETVDFDPPKNGSHPNLRRPKKRGPRHQPSPKNDHRRIFLSQGAWPWRWTSILPAVHTWCCWPMPAMQRMILAKLESYFTKHHLVSWSCEVAIIC